ncbi:unnamed protein product [Dicrocoelium dendriticum]|nr:unnamed protein product [Dicrocoelium dendriticum]
MSLADQLKRLAVPVVTSYSVDLVRRKSLVYDDPSKVDTLTCYQKSVKAFETLVQRDNVFAAFAQTLFAETSCSLEMCNLFDAEKKQLDDVISRFLFFISPFLRFSEVLHAVEWLVHKFQVHIYYVEDFIRCVMPYHETGVFPKFLQLIDFNACPSEFRWMKPYAEAGKSMSRPQLSRECLRQPSLIPFLCGLFLNAIKLSKECNPGRLNDLANFFLSTLTALCDKGIPDTQLANVVDSFQYVIQSGLRAEHCPPFQSAACLIAIRLSLKLRLNHTLILNWIEALLRHSRPTNAWESLRVIIKLMRHQQIPLLPEKFAKRYSKLCAELSTSERELLEAEENLLIEKSDANQLAVDALKNKPHVQAATMLVDLEIPEPTSRAAITPAHVPDNVELLPDFQSQLNVLHALIASLPDPGGGCLFNNEQCPCPKLSSVHCDQNWLCDLLYPVLLSASSSSFAASRFDLRRTHRLLECTRRAIAAHVEAFRLPFSPPNTRSSSAAKSPSNQRTPSYRPSFSKTQRTLEHGLDRALPLLIAFLSHPAASVRTEVYRMLAFWLAELTRNGWTADETINPFLTETLRLLGATGAVNPITNTTELLPEALEGLLLGDPLFNLGTSAPRLVKVAIHLLFSESLSFSPGVMDIPVLLWTYGLRFLSDSGISELFHVRSSSAWVEFLDLIRRGSVVYPALHSACLSLLTPDLFSTLRSLTSSKGTPHGGLAGETGSAQLQLLDALHDLAMAETSDYNLVETVLTRLSLGTQHLDYLLVKLDTSRAAIAHSANKSLYARVIEAREHRRQQLKQSNTPAGEDSTEVTKLTNIHSTRLSTQRLKLLGSLLIIITDSVERLHSSGSLQSAKSDQNDSVLHILSRLTPDLTVNSRSIRTLSSQKPDGVSILVLLTPLVNHLVSLLNEAHTSASPKSITSASESDDDADTSVGPLPMDLDLSGCADTPKCVGSLSPCMPSLVRHCVYRLLVCMTAILAEINRTSTKRRPRRLRVPSSPDTHSTSTALLAAQSAVDPVFQCLPTYPDWAALHQQVLLCFVELAAMFPVVLCERLVSLIQWVTNSPQFMRLDTVHSLSLVGRLIVIAVPALIQASTDQTKSALQVLVLFVDGLPALTGRFPKRRLAFYTGLIRGLAHSTSPFALEFLSTTPIKGNLIKSDKQKRRLERQQHRTIVERCKQAWIGSWLWATSLVFLNRDWFDKATADQVVPLLLELHNQFAWDVQVNAWYECLTFFLWVSKHNSPSGGIARSKKLSISDMHAPPLEVVDTEISSPPSKRRLTDPGTSDRTSQALELSMDLTVDKLSSPRVTEALVTALFGGESDRSMTVNSTSPSFSIFSMWSLISRAVQLLNSLLSDPTYDHKLQTASNDPLGFGAVYGRLVQQIVQLMLNASAVLTDDVTTPTSTGPSEPSAMHSVKQTLTGLQTILIQIHDSVSGDTFIRMVSDLFDSSHHGLRRKALDLLTAKLNSLTVYSEPSPILFDSSIIPVAEDKVKKRAKRRRSRQIDLTLQSGLVRFTAQLSSQYDLGSCYARGHSGTTGTPHPKPSDLRAFGSSFSRQCLACLRDLARLLASRYPGEFLRTMDILIANLVYWWPLSPTVDGSNRPREPRGSGLAESRSLMCLFFVECLQRLPAQSLCPDASATVHRLGSILAFSLDHTITSCHLARSPTITVEWLQQSGKDVVSSTTLMTGLVHSRHEHLLAGLTLLDNLLELAVVNRRIEASSSDSSTSRVHWLQFDSDNRTTSATYSCRMSDILLRLVFQLSQLNIASATGANLERSGHTLRQITAFIQQIRQLLMHVTDVGNLLEAVQRILKDAFIRPDVLVTQGALLFLGDLAELAFRDSRTEQPTIENLRKGWIQISTTRPDLLQHLVTFSLRSTTSPAYSNTTARNALYHAVSAVLAASPSEVRLRLCHSVFAWAVTIGQDRTENKSEQVALNASFDRLSMTFCIMSGLSDRIGSEAFSELSKQLCLVDYVVLSFYIATGRKSKGIRKLAERLSLKSCIGQLANGATEEALRMISSAVECLRKWLLCEIQTIRYLDLSSGGHTVLELPAAFVSLLDVTSVRDPTEPIVGPPPITEFHLAQALDALVDSIAADEALLRPLGAALASRVIHGSHWRVRLAAIHLLKNTFDRLASSDNIDGSMPATAHCLVSDTLSALSEALEDDRSEVETAANKLFAELEQRGLSGRTESS